ncbi:MAG: hypothetical protein JWO54_764 [Candidatus Saccharibacteria bacterium]|nr:hypothetical protein [Candidatus Saccharibacteria bacterium]MDB5181001.1 hypothetical protein [Candidatus Saccharibacteria bacterium]
MANEQYTIPDGLFEAEPTADFSEQPEIQEVQQYTPEPQSTHFNAYEYQQELKSRLYAGRQTAIAMEENKHKILKAAKAIIIKPKPILAELIEAESKIGGRPWKIIEIKRKEKSKKAEEMDYRLWEEKGGWFFGYTNGKDIKLEDTTIHYIFKPDSIEKRFHGRTFPMNDGEERTLIQAIQLFDDAVMEELYPIDQALSDLKKDDFRLAA